MSNTSDSIDAAAFGLPTDVNGQPGFMYADSDLDVDVNDPIYKSVKAAMEADAAARGTTVPPLPADAPRPPVMKPAKEGDDANEPTTPETPAGHTDPNTPDPTAGEPGTTSDAGADASETTTPAVEPGTFALQIDGQDYTLNTEQAEYLLRLNSWLESIPEETKQQWSAIEQGTAVTISVEELTRLRAAAQAPVQKPAAPAAPNVDDLDDDVVEYIRSLEQRVAPMTQMPGADVPGQPPIPVADLAAAANRQAEVRMQRMVELQATSTAWQEQWGLTDEQMQRVAQVATDLQVVPRLTQQRTQYSPTGQVLREPAFGDIVREAYEMAMNADPTLREIRDEIIYTRRVAEDAQRNAGVNAKKAKAGTLAAAPSAAVPATGAAPKIGPDNKMNLQETSNAIAAALAEMAGQG